MFVLRKSLDRCVCLLYHTFPYRYNKKKRIYIFWGGKSLNQPACLLIVPRLIPQQRKLMGSSAENSSGVHWCRRRVKFNEVPEKVRNGEGLGGFGAEPGQVQQDSGEGSGEGEGGFGAEPGQVQQGSGEGPGEGGGGFGAEPGQVQQGSGEGSGEGLRGFGAEPGQVQQGSGEGSGECLGGFGAEPGQGSGEGCGEGFGEVRFSSLFSCMCTRHTWISLEQLCFSEFFLRFVLIMPI